MVDLTERSRKIDAIPYFLAIVPILVLICLLVLNVWMYGGDATGGANQIALLLAAGAATLVGVFLSVPVRESIQGMVSSLSSALNAILILLLIGGLTGTWMLGGIVPSMVFYGLKILTPETFLVATVLICSVVSVATGSSWTTVASVGVALLTIGNALGIPPAMAAGAIISGAYFGDKISPLSDTTNLAPAMAGTDLFTHIRYMLWTTIPSYIITLIVFVIFSYQIELKAGEVSTEELSNIISTTFNISPFLFLVPAAVVVMIIMKIDAATTLFIAMLLGGLVAIIFQPQLIDNHAPQANVKMTFAPSEMETAESTASPTQAAPSFVAYPLKAYNAVINAIANKTTFDDIANEKIRDLLASKGMSGMLSTIWLIFCAMCFGGAMEAVGLLERITRPLIAFAQSTGSLIGTTAATCLIFNVTASDQYLAIVVPGRMFRKAFEDRGLAPQNLSRTLEDSGTVTSVLVPWNTCGATQSGVLGISTMAYAPYCVFNYVSPLMTVFFGAFQIAIAKKLDSSKA